MGQNTSVRARPSAKLDFDVQILSTSTNTAYEHTCNYIAIVFWAVKVDQARILMWGDGYRG